MEQIELLKVYAYAGAIWSSFKIPKGETEAKIHDAVWFGVLKPYPIEMVLTAIQEYALENDFCNIAKIGDICKRYTEKANGTYIDAEEVLSEIRGAISYYDCKKNFEKLSPFAKQIVEDPSYLARWSQCQAGQVDTVVISNLRKKINNVLEEKKHDDIMALTMSNTKLIK